jgi:cytochrome P450
MDGAIDLKALDEARNDARTRPLASIDVSDPGLFQNGTWGPYFERLRRDAPVHYCAKSPYGPYWSVTRYKDILKVDSDWQTYSSDAYAGGINVLDLPMELRRPSFITMDPPRHDNQRKTVSPIVAPQNLANMEGLIRERTCKVLAGLPRGETFDWVERVSIELTTLMLATMFDWPVEDKKQLTLWSDIGIANINDPDSPVKTEEERFAKLKEMAEAMAVLYNERAQLPPRFDLLSMLAHSSATKDLPLKEFMGTLTLLLVGGNDTTRNTMTGSILGLNQFPAEYDKLRANPDLIESMVSETIRFVTPVIHMRRNVTVDTELCGQKIKAGEKVVMWYASGNRDPDAIENPDAFIIDRKNPRQHLSFGFGVHRCVGNRLAELQLKILWQELLARFPKIEVMGEPKRTFSNFIHGIRSLPVRIPA